MVRRSSAFGEGVVELFGVPRLLAGRRSLPVAGASLRDVAAALAEACPALVGPVIDRETGWLGRGYVFVVDETFTNDPATTLGPNAAVLLVSSVAGG